MKGAAEIPQPNQGQLGTADKATVVGVVAPTAYNEGTLPEPIEGKPLYNTNDLCGVDPSTEQALKRFVVPGYKDVWAGALFLLTLLLTVVLAMINFGDAKAWATAPAEPSTVPAPTGTDGFSNPTTPTQSTVTLTTVLLMITGLLLASGFSGLVALVGLGKFPQKAIYICNTFVVVLYVICAVLMAIGGLIWMALLFVLLGAFQILWLYYARHRIPFAALLLKLSCHLVLRYKAAILSGFFGASALYIYLFFYTSMSLPVNRRMVQDVNDPNKGQVSPADGALSTFYVFLLFWTSQVILNVCHVTVSGLVATWYFCGERNMPPNPTWASFKRAMSTSFGSICFGSLLVAIIKTLRYLARSSEGNNNAFVRLVAACVLSCLERILEYFNTYAFVHIAVYGCGYVEASKRTWRLAKGHFWQAAFNDCLISPTISWTAFGIALLDGVVCGILLGAAFGVLAFICSFAVILLVLRCIESAVPTIFVCYCESPESLMISSPELYTMLHAADHGVSQTA